jgi:hypothetical protein
MIAIIGWVGSALCVWSLVQGNQARFRALNLAACIALIAFNFANMAWSGVLLNVVVSGINIRQLCVLRAAAKQAERAKQVSTALVDQQLVELIEAPFASV